MTSSFERFAPRVRKLGAALVLLLLAGCAVGPTHTPPVVTPVTVWHAPLPHGGEVASLTGWWSHWNDATLLALIEAAQATSPTLEQAVARINQARAGQSIAGASVQPGLTGNGNVSYGNQAGQSLGLGAAATATAALQAAWEVDLFGANRRGREVAAARFDARSIDWHQARVSLAADVALIYANLRVNEALVLGFERDVVSRNETARLTGLKTDAGFEAPANAQLARASASEAAARLTAQRAEVDLGVKGLVALTGLREDALRAMLAERRAQLPSGAPLAIEPLPAAVLGQRPDLAASERELAALIAEIGAAEADRYPRLTLLGSVGYSVARIAGGSGGASSWGFGPSVDIPLFDAGRRKAVVVQAQARYDEAVAGYKAAATRAVREVEEALTQMQSAKLRTPDLQAALVGYQAFEKAAQARLTAGAGSVLELQEARRAVLSAQLAVLGVERERITASISLYRAAGGGWDRADGTPARNSVLTPIQSLEKK
jgi:outer membrane protein, multidrug efflux system